MRSQSENLRNGIACGDRNILRRQAAGEQSSASIDLLCKFLVNPFGNVEQARELLSQIESRSIDDAELQRGEFCFQIAFYFLACLAIAAHITDPISQKSCINRLYDRVRRFCARTDLTVKFSDFIVTVDERDQFVAGLRELLEKTGEEHGDISRAVMTKLGIFDLIVCVVCMYQAYWASPTPLRFLSRR